MANWELNIGLKKNGQHIDGSPFTRRLELTEDESINHAKAADGDGTTFSALTSANIAELRALLIRGDGITTVRLDGQSDAGIVLQPNGILLLFDVDIDAGAGASNISANNNTGAAVQLEGVVAGD